MTRYQTNRLARKACVQLIKWGSKPDLGRVKAVVNRKIIRTAKSNNGGNQKSKSEMAAEMAKDILLSMGDKLSYPDNFEYYFGKLFNQVYRAVSLDDKDRSPGPNEG